MDRWDNLPQGTDRARDYAVESSANIRSATIVSRAKQPIVNTVAPKIPRRSGKKQHAPTDSSDSAFRPHRQRAKHLAHRGEQVVKPNLEKARAWIPMKKRGKKRPRSTRPAENRSFSSGSGSTIKYITSPARTSHPFGGNRFTRA